MRIELHRRNGAVHFEALNGEGNSVAIDGSPAIGGEGLGFRPMQLALTALASCASMDVVSILAKQRQPLEDLRVTATGDRPPGEPSPFSTVNLHFDLHGDLGEDAVRKALDLAVHKYCSVGAMLRGNVEITWTMTIHRTGSQPHRQNGG
ncbi:MAG: OsmC family peroxiredoxin [Spirochaetaceae bacterium]|nr:MAG: OsmC family peroxiredoxin [Spirochaetaceae bacterium]